MGKPKVDQIVETKKQETQMQKEHATSRDLLPDMHSGKDKDHCILLESKWANFEVEKGVKG